MAKALMGTHASPSSLRLLDEVRSLRERVAQLEAALAEAESAGEIASQRVQMGSRLEDRLGGVVREPART